MLKQKLIPLASALLVLTGCGGSGAMKIKINKQVETMLFSEAFNVKKGQKLTFSLLNSDFIEKEEDYLPGSTFCFIKGEFVESSIILIDEEKTINVTCNGKKMKQYEGTLGEFLDHFEDGGNPEEVENMFAIQGDEIEGSEMQFLSLYHKDKKSTDKINITAFSKIEENDVVAASFNQFPV